MLNTFYIEELSFTLTTNSRTLSDNFQKTVQIYSRFPGFPAVLDTLY